MRITMRATAEPANEPVTLGQLRDHVRGDAGVDDAALLGFGISARTWIEQWLGRPVVPVTVRGVAESWPCKGSMTLLMPVISVDLVSYTDADQIVATWPAGPGGWVARNSQGGVTSVRPAAGSSWPVLGVDPVITIEATAGFALLPEPVVTAICKLAGYLHADRDGMGDQAAGYGRLPRDIRELVKHWRWQVLA